MELKQIQCFLMVAEYLNFSTAAEQMFLSQPSLSRHISNLEQELGIALFLRDKRSVTLTEAGVQFLSSARNMVNAGAEMLHTAQNLREGRQGRLRIGYQSSARFVLPPILRLFRDRYPDVELTIEEYGAAQLTQQLEMGNLDIVFAFSLIRGNRKEYAHFQSYPLFVDHMALFMGQELYSRIQSRKKLLQTFSQETFFQIDRRENPPYHEVLHSIYLQRRFVPWQIEEHRNLSTLMLLVQAQCGVSLLPLSATLQSNSHACGLLLENVDVELPIEAMWHPRNINPCLPPFCSLFPETSLTAFREKP